MGSNPAPREGKWHIMTYDPHLTERAERTEQPRTGSPAPPIHPARPDRTPDRTPGGAPGPVLLPQDERDKLTMRLQQTLNTFVESPRQAVEEAEGLFDDAVTRLTESLTEHRRVLRASWQGQDTDAQTEELRLALRQYRESTERLLHI